MARWRRKGTHHLPYFPSVNRAQEIQMPCYVCRTVSDRGTTGRAQGDSFSPSSSIISLSQLHSKGMRTEDIPVPAGPSGSPDEASGGPVPQSRLTVQSGGALSYTVWKLHSDLKRREKFFSPGCHKQQPSLLDWPWHSH